MTQTLKDAVNTHLEEHVLDEDQLQSLESLMAHSEASGESTKFVLRKKWLWVALMLCLVLGAILWPVFSNQQTDIHTAIAYEVVKNHRKLKPLEIKSGDIQSTQTFFAKLDFKLVENSNVLSKQSWSLQGGRYCSIQGHDAAQLRYKKANEEVVSVYMAPYVMKDMGKVPDVKKGQRPLKRTVNGLNVWIWVEDGVLLVATP